MLTGGCNGYYTYCQDWTCRDCCIHIQPVRPATRSNRPAHVSDPVIRCPREERHTLSRVRAANLGSNVRATSTSTPFSIPSSRCSVKALSSCMLSGDCMLLILSADRWLLKVCASSWGDVWGSKVMSSPAGSYIHLARPPHSASCRSYPMDGAVFTVMVQSWLSCNCQLAPRSKGLSGVDGFHEIRFRTSTKPVIECTIPLGQRIHQSRQRRQAEEPGELFEMSAFWDVALADP